MSQLYRVSIFEISRAFSSALDHVKNPCYFEALCDILLNNNSFLFFKFLIHDFLVLSWYRSVTFFSYAKVKLWIIFVSKRSRLVRQSTMVLNGIFVKKVYAKY